MILYNDYLKSLPFDAPAEIIEKFNTAYTLYSSQKYSSDNNNSKLVHELLTYLFKSNYGNILIPIGFLQDPLGIVLFSLQFGSSELDFSPSQVSVICGISRTVVSRDANNDKLFRYENGRVGKKYILEYMEAKGIPFGSERIDMFLHLKDKGLSREDIAESIKEQFDNAKKKI